MAHHAYADSLSSKSLRLILRNHGCYYCIPTVFGRRSGESAILHRLLTINKGLPLPSKRLGCPSLRLGSVIRPVSDDPQNEASQEHGTKDPLPCGARLRKEHLVSITGGGVSGGEEKIWRNKKKAAPLIHQLGMDGGPRKIIPLAMPKKGKSGEDEVPIVVSTVLVSNFSCMQASKAGQGRRGYSNVTSLLAIGHRDDVINYDLGRRHSLLTKLYSVEGIL
ncbi:hypothetical protein BDV26DRAFT_170430 [Aspergillus bertholletiae]|uniref:Uncharacterized protein n=1 Tax=Aspergillus bertholletiae TaxID=1226010 RepID=A0A5N7BCE3_9EURO|nr:hypothetical protein BDV26DRAFT_170430 [Aspergillus bertholletiae]